MKRVCIVLVTILAVAAFAGCGVRPDTISPISGDETIYVKIGETCPIELTGDFGEQELTNEAKVEALAALNLTWASADASVATVDNKGTVTGVAGGKTEITAKTLFGGLETKINIQVTEPIETITMLPELPLEIGGEDSASLEAKVTPEFASINDITFTSSDEAVATVDASGTVTAVGKGETVITAAAEGVTAECKVSVGIKPTGIELADGAGWIYAGYQHKLDPRTLPDGARETTYTFSSSDANVATVSENGTISGKGIGSAVITVTSAEGFTAEYAVTVNAKPKPTYSYSGGSSGSGSSGGGGSDGGGAADSGGSGGGGSSLPPGTSPIDWDNPVYVGGEGEY